MTRILNLFCAGIAYTRPREIPDRFRRSGGDHSPGAGRCRGARCARLAARSTGMAACRRRHFPRHADFKLMFLACSPLFGPIDIHSPSGHVAAATVVSGRPGGDADAPRATASCPSAVLAAVVIGISRLVLGMHSLPEVIVGALIGLAGAGALLRSPGRRPAADRSADRRDRRCRRAVPWPCTCRRRPRSATPPSAPRNIIPACRVRRRSSRGASRGRAEPASVTVSPSRHVHGHVTSTVARSRVFPASRPVRHPYSAALLMKIVACNSNRPWPMLSPKSSACR